ncbi:MAG: hypothetical protein HWQ38_34485 [Nostoc sp. NMS7]|uniref:hypothetical protein n=1 Tax=Nostoc sp. NMS7 TaxID=2815391 RepID=UPI0025DE467D|nr:hypothetical protein [Nostoc sp. NMS7]MBN3951306.1 hypothetical protein [Nostoc sp. NMS7]
MQLSSHTIIIQSENFQEFPSLGTLSLSLRKPTKGVEYEMVYKYIQSKLLSPSENGELKFIFLEPQIDSGFPDIVIVYFQPDIAKKWLPTRLKITKLDLRILHYIFSELSVETSTLEMVFPNYFYKSLRRLLEANLIHCKEGRWEAKPLEEIFAIQRLIVIEAKINNWQQGLNQAFQNTWFASESYLLLPNLPSNSDLIWEAKILFSGSQPSSTGFRESESFRHYLQTLRTQTLASRRSSFDESVEYHRNLLDSAEQILQKLRSVNIRDKARDFEEVIDTNRAALSYIEDYRGVILRRNWSKLF